MLILHQVHFVDSRTAQGLENDPNSLSDLERCVWAVLEQFSVDERLSLIAFGTGTPVWTAMLSDKCCRCSQMS